MSRLWRNARCARPAGAVHPTVRTFGLTDDEPAEAQALPVIAAHGVRAADPSARKGARPFGPERRTALRPGKAHDPPIDALSGKTGAAAARWHTPTSSATAG
ncbi:hypothetical protein GCM10022226_59910 [Sphaerisporangium flaviroseum]|uniref:Uncharacterized protein n=1 Tax=Sphaerisporangium flaviroseum TaxID=509199 RepID=A0ABP7J0L9_9ACTN